jgi:hypothetical protein
MYRSLNLLEPMGEVINVTGNQIRAAGWYGPTTGLHTIAIKVENFQGQISIQGTVATDPGESDWFSVLPDAAAYIQYPRVSFVVKSPATGESSNTGYSFSSNIVWIRALVNRSYLIPALAYPAFIGSFGLVEYILVNY